MKEKIVKFIKDEAKEDNAGMDIRQPFQRSNMRKSVSDSVPELCIDTGCIDVTKTSSYCILDPSM